METPRYITFGLCVVTLRSELFQLGRLTSGRRTDGLPLTAAFDPLLPAVGGRYRATQSVIGLLTLGLLVIVLGEAICCTKFARLRRRGHAAGRLSVAVTVDPPVDQTEIPHAIGQRHPRLLT